MTFCMILTTCPDKDEAGRIAAGLIKEKLAACVQLSEVNSYYTWEKKTCIDTEFRLVIKTGKKLYPLVEKFIKKHHSYDVPQIIEVPITDGSEEFLAWLNENTSDRPDL